MAEMLNHQIESEDFEKARHGERKDDRERCFVELK